MKKIYAIPMFIAVAAMTFASCAQEMDAPTTVGTTKVFIGAQAVDELDTKVALETTDDAIFTPSWQAGDQITLIYSGATQGTATGTWDATANAFAFDVPEAVASTTGNWEYTVTYGNGATFAAARSQTGNAMNGAFDLMRGTKTVSSSLFGKDGENPLIVSINRQTSILYFHITNRGSGIVEPVTKAVLKAADGEVLAATAETSEKGVVTNGNETNTLTLNIADGIDMNDAAGIKLWFNVLPGTYSSLSLEVETASYKFEIDTKSTVESTTLTAGRLTKIVGKAKNNYTLKEGTVEHGENVFDCCDYSPYASGVTISASNYPVVDTVNKKVGGASLSFDLTVGGILGTIQFLRATPLQLDWLNEGNGVLEFWLYSSKAIALSESGKCMRLELGTGGKADTDDYEWEYNTDIAEGWNKISLPIYSRRVVEGTPDLSKGLNFIRMWMEGLTSGVAYTIKLDDIRLVKNSMSIITPMCGDQYTSFRNSHPVYSPDKKTVYVLSGASRTGTRGGYVCAIDLETATLKWMYDASHTDAKNIMVNPANGDIIFATTDKKVRCLSKDGELKWTNSDIQVFGSGLAVNGDGSVVILAGHSTVHSVNNRDIWALNATTGEVLSMLYNTATSGNNVYCGNAQVVFVKEDSEYEYLVLHGNELMTFLKLSKADKTLSRVRDENSTTVNIAGGNKACTDICSPAVSPDKKYAFFPLGSGYISVANIETMALAGILFNGGGMVSGIAFNGNGDMITTANKYVYRFPSTEYEGKFNASGTTAANQVNMSPSFLGTTPTGTDNAFNYIVAGVAQSGALYAAVGDGSSNTDWGKILKWVNSTTSSVGSIYLDRVQNPGADAGYQACFSMTDHYLVLGNKGAFGCITIMEIDDVIAPNTWGYYGGDPCASKNVKWVYGSY